jgi:monoamine oxidase
LSVIFGGDYAAEPEDCSLYWESQSYLDYEGEDFVIPGGFGSLTSKIGSVLDVKLEHVVKQISYSEKGVNIYTNQGNFEGIAALVTVPLG